MSGAPSTRERGAFPGGAVANMRQRNIGWRLDYGARGRPRPRATPAVHKDLGTTTTRPSSLRCRSARRVGRWRPRLSSSLRADIRTALSSASLPRRRGVRTRGRPLDLRNSRGFSALAPPRGDGGACARGAPLRADAYVIGMPVYCTHPGVLKNFLVLHVQGMHESRSRWLLSAEAIVIWRAPSPDVSSTVAGRPTRVLARRPHFQVQSRRGPATAARADARLLRLGVGDGPATGAVSGVANDWGCVLGAPVACAQRSPHEGWARPDV